MKLEPLLDQEIKTEEDSVQNQACVNLTPDVPSEDDLQTSKGKTKFKEMLQESSDSNDVCEAEKKEEKAVIETVAVVKEENLEDVPENNKIKLGKKEDKNSENSNKGSEELIVKLEDDCKVEEKLNGSVPDEANESGGVSDSTNSSSSRNKKFSRLSKRKKSKQAERETLEELSKEIYSSRQPLDRTKSPPTSPTNEGSENSRRTRCSFNPNFAQKQKKFLAMVSSSCWDDDESADANFEERSFEPKSKSSHNDSGVSVHSVKKEREIKNDVKSNSNPFVVRRGRPTKEMVAYRMKMKQDRGTRSRRPDLTQIIQQMARTPKNIEEDTFIIDDKDRFCWACHRVDKHHASIQCVTCPRVYHVRCIRGQCESAEKNNWSCPECTLSLKMESFENQSESMKLISADEFCLLLTRTVEFLSSLPGAEVFKEPVNLVDFPDYRDHIVNPVHLGKIQANIDKKLYGSTESFIADIKWLYHNSVIFNGLNTALTAVAKSILVRCKGKMNQLERCVDCFKKSFDVSISESFLEACRQPHLLVWAKFKGYPFWPSKVFHWKMDAKNNCIIEVKFFNDYSRAWVPSKSVFLFSKKSPAEVYLANSKDIKSYQNALVEVQQHISNLQERFGKFVYAPPKTEFDPDNYDEYLRAMLPEYDPEKLRAQNTLVSSSKSTTPHKRKGSSEQDLTDKECISPKSFKKKKLRRVRRISNSDPDFKPSTSYEEKIKKTKMIENNYLLSKRKVKLDTEESYSSDESTKNHEQIKAGTKIVITDIEVNSFRRKIKRKLSDSGEDSTELKKMLLADTKDGSSTLSTGTPRKELQEGSQKPMDHESSDDFINPSIVDEPSSSTEVKRRASDHSDKVSSLEKYSKPSEISVQTVKTMLDLVNQKSQTAGTEETGTKPSGQLQKLLEKGMPEKESPRKKSSPTGRKNRASSSRTSSSDVDESIFSSLSERPIGMETEARRLRVNPVSFDHEGTATRMFNFSVQQLVPLVSEALSNMMGKLALSGNKDALIQILRLQMEETQQKHKQEITSLKHVMNQQYLEYAHTSDIIRKQTEQKWSQKVAELEEALRREKENLKTERDRWEKKVINLTTALREHSSPPKEVKKDETG